VISSKIGWLNKTESSRQWWQWVIPLTNLVLIHLRMLILTLLIHLSRPRIKAIQHCTTTLLCYRAVWCCSVFNMCSKTGCFQLSLLREMNLIEQVDFNNVCQLFLVICYIVWVRCIGSCIWATDLGQSNAVAGARASGSASLGSVSGVQLHQGMTTASVRVCRCGPQNPT